MGRVGFFARIMLKTFTGGVEGLASRTAWTYLGAGVAWILVTDLASAWVVAAPPSNLWVNVGKGLLFVAASSLLIYGLLRRSVEREVGAIQKSLTALVESERQTRQLNRTLAAITSAKTVVLRSRSEPALLQGFCDAMVRASGHRLIWVGLVSEPGAEIRVFARAGEEKGYLDEIVSGAALEGAGFGPSEAAVRAGRACIWHEGTEAEGVVEWRLRASRAGIRSVMALPLQTEDRVVGVLTLCSVEPHRFDEQEVNLLESVAADLAYAISVLRQAMALAATEATLARERHLRESIMAHSTALVYVADLEDRILYANPEFDRAVGSPLGGSVGRLRSEILPAEVASQHFANDREVARSGQPIRVEEMNDEPNGRQVYFTIKFPMRDETGRIVAVGGISTNVTESKRTETALQLHTAMVQNVNEGINLCRAKDGIILQTNPQFDLLFGYGPGELIGRPISVLNAPGEVAPERTVAMIIEALDRDGRWQGEVQNIRKDGVRFWSRATVSVFDHEQHGKVWVSAQHDITARRNAEAQLELQSAALSAAANVIVITDPAGAIEWVNAAFTRVTGYTAEEVRGMNPSLLSSGNQPAEFYQNMWRTILDGRVWHGEFHNRRKDGTNFEEDATITPLRDAGGRITHFIAIKQDITEKKALERRFLRAQRMESIGMLAGGIAHDLNNVLAPMLMGTQLLKMVVKDPMVVQQLVRMEACALRGGEIVKQVLTFARGVEGERVPVQPKHIVKEVLQMARETFPRNVQILQELPKNCWQVLGDPTQLHQVLLNLCVNARDAMPGGGALTVSTRNVEVEENLASKHPGASCGPHVVLSVRDEGTGIPADVMDHIFEPFFTTKPLGSGTGLGLSTVSGIAQSHGGFITVESRVNEGTTFDVYFPAIQESETTAASKEISDVPVGHGQLILAVDDERSILDVMRVLLERHGYRVITAQDGRTGLGLLSQNLGEVKLMITDALMPVMDGLELIRRVRDQDPQLPVIVVTGALSIAGQGDRAEQIRAMGVRHMITKPYSIELLLRAIHSELNR